MLLSESFGVISCTRYLPVEITCSCVNLEPFLHGRPVADGTTVKLLAAAGVVGAGVAGAGIAGAGVGAGAVGDTVAGVGVLGAGAAAFAAVPFVPGRGVVSGTAVVAVALRPCGGAGGADVVAVVDGTAAVVALVPFVVRFGVAAGNGAGFGLSSAELTTGGASVSSWISLKCVAFAPPPVPLVLDWLFMTLVRFPDCDCSRALITSASAAESISMPMVSRMSLDEDDEDVDMEPSALIVIAGDAAASCERCTRWPADDACRANLGRLRNIIAAGEDVEDVDEDPSRVARVCIWLGDFPKRLVRPCLNIFFAFFPKPFLLMPLTLKLYSAMR